MRGQYQSDISKPYIQPSYTVLAMTRSSLISIYTISLAVQYLYCFIFFHNIFNNVLLTQELSIAHTPIRQAATLVQQIESLSLFGTNLYEGL